MDTTFEIKSDFSQGTSFLKPIQLAGYLQISRTFANHLLQTGEILTVCIGHTHRVRPQDLLAYIERNIRSDVADRLHSV